MLRSDLHIHTLMSGHAFCTMNECIDMAQNRKLSLIAITDHGPAMEHSAHEGYFKMSKRLPKLIGRLNVLFGCEMNILNSVGDVDLSNETMSELDIVLAGIHTRTPYSETGEAKNTTAMINAMMRHPEINIITHPFRAEFPISVCDIAQAAKEYNVILEINLSLLLRAINSKTDNNFAIVVDKTAELISCIHSEGGSYLINSDAHYSNEIGIDNEQYKTLIAELGILPEYVLNNNINALKSFIPSIIFDGGV
ncbi:MAG: PHP domain-containing protein [Lachnospiraceae bacterium]|nr:PHP domain-containing protein [Lachnospiraceae bacterium]